ncbi:LysR family transcriptional regulator [Vibrio sp. AK197]
MNLLHRDLNLLLIFHVLYQEQNASRAAEILAISQPALSHKLNKLRHEWNDSLFVKAPRGLTPTPKAHSIAKQINQLVPNLERFYSAHIEPHFEQRDDRIYIYTTDYIEQLLFPPLLCRIRKCAPNVTVITRNTRGALPRTELEKGQCDLAIAGFFKQLPDTFRQQSLMNQPFVVLANTQNQHIRDELDLESYLASEHLVTTLTGDLNGVIDQQLNQLGRQRRIMAGLSSFLVPSQIIADGECPNLVVTCLQSLAKQAVEREPKRLVIHELPLEIPTATISQVWHERTHADPLRKWLREQIKDILSCV